MPTYIDADYIKARVDDSKLDIWTSEEGSSTLDLAVINNGIDDAEAELNGFLNRRYEVPFTGDDITNQVKKLTFDIAIYNISTARHSDEPLQDLALRYDKAIEKLNSIKDGNEDLTGITAAKRNSSQDKIFSNSDSDTRKFTRDNFESYRTFEGIG